MTTTRRLALAAGVFYLLTFVFSIPAYFLYEPVLTDPAYIVSGGSDTQVILGSFLDLVTAFAGIGTAVALFWVVKRQSEGFALGFVTTRVMEGAIIVVSTVALLTVVALRQEGATGAEATMLTAIQQALVTVRDWTFLFGPGLMPVLNAVLLYDHVPIAARAKDHPGGGTDRRTAAVLLDDRHDVRSQRPPIGVDGHRDDSDLLLGVVSRPVDDIQGLQPVRPDLVRGSRESRRARHVRCGRLGCPCS